MKRKLNCTGRINRINFNRINVECNIKILKKNALVLSMISFVILGMFHLSQVAYSQTKSFVVGVEDLSYLPYYSAETGDYTGLGRDVLDAFAKKHGYIFKYQNLPLERLFKYFVGGKLDFKYPDTPMWQKVMKKGKKITYSEMVVNYIDGVMVLPKRKGAGLGKIKVLGTIKGFTVWDYLEHVKAKSVAIDEVYSMNSLLKKTLAGRVDGAYLNIEVAKYNLEKSLNRPNGLVFDGGLPHTKGSYYLSSIKHPEIIKQFNAFLKEDKAKVDALKKKYKID